MKIALIYTGLPKTNSQILDTHIKYLINIYSDIDIYIHTYNNDNDSLVLIKKTLNPIAIYTDTISTIENKVKDIAQRIPQIGQDVRPINVLSMYYKWMKSLDFINNKNYNIIIRNRLDIMFTQPINLIENNSINIPCGGDHWGGLMDLFAYGNKHNMIQYKQIYLYLYQYLFVDKIIFHPETLLRHHVKTHNLHTKRFDCPIVLRDQVFTNTAPCYK